MTHWLKPRVLVSRCIEFDACRWNVERVSDPWVAHFKDYFDFIPVCPELEIGLGLPRPPIRIVKIDECDHLIQPLTGLDISEKMSQFSQNFLDNIPEIDGCILKSRSPSCGLSDVKFYSSKRDVLSLGKTCGFFGRSILERYPHLAIEDENRLKNFRLREHFLTRLYRSTQFRAVNDSGQIGELVNLHTQNKYLVMASREMQMQNLYKISANQEKYPYPVELMVIPDSGKGCDD